MKVNGVTIVVRRQGIPIMIKKGWIFLATQGKKTSHYAPLDNNTKQYTKKVFFLNYVLFCTTAKVITVYSYLEKDCQKKCTR